MIETKVIKKDNSLQDWDSNKIARAINLASERAQEQLTANEINEVIEKVENIVKQSRVIQVTTLHDIVMSCLYDINHAVYVEYKAYRNYKEKYKKSFANAYEFSSKIVSGSFKENANKDSELNSTKQSLIVEGFMKEMMVNFELKPEWVEAHENCFIHIHDLGSRFIKSHNCNLFRLGEVMKGGFYLNGIYYNEPKSVQSMFQVGGDIALSASSQQYGGFTIPKIDFIMERGCEYSYNKYYNDFIKYMDKEIAEKLAEEYTIREISQGWQAFETKLNTISNSLGQTPFITVTFGLSTSKWGREVQKAILTQRLNGLGEKKTTAIFPKLVYLHRKEIADGPNKDIKDLAIECSRKRLYPDWLSGDEGYQKEVYEKTGTMVDPMGQY